MGPTQPEGEIERVLLELRVPRSQSLNPFSRWRQDLPSQASNGTQAMLPSLRSHSLVRCECRVPPKWQSQLTNANR
jgi:hypothetical protein